jgi:hypothetical protein
MRRRVRWSEREGWAGNVRKGAPKEEGDMRMEMEMEEKQGEWTDEEDGEVE